MSLEQSIADLQTQAGLLLDLPQEITGVAINQITAVGQSYQTLISALTATYTVDAINGDDVNPGTDALPFKTLKPAVENTPRGARLSIKLVSNITVVEDIQFENRDVIFLPADGLTKEISFSGRQGNDIGGGTIGRSLNGFRYASGAVFSFYNIKIVPAAPVGAELSWTPLWTAGVIRPESGTGAKVSVFIYAGEVAFPADMFGQLVVGAAVDLIVSGTAISGAAAGKWLGSEAAGLITDTNGTLPSSIHWLQTNLTSI